MAKTKVQKKDKNEDFNKLAQAFIDDYQKLVVKHKVQLQAYISDLGPKMRIIPLAEEE